MKTATVRAIGLIFSVVFASAGLFFLLAPESVLTGLNSLGRSLGMGESPVHGQGFFSAMTSAYMAVVTILSWRMFRFPTLAVHPLLLAQAKAASSLFSLGIFMLHSPYFILLVNGVLDGGLAIAAFAIFRSIRHQDGSVKEP